jgi:subtilisin family serine protease
MHRVMLLAGLAALAAMLLSFPAQAAPDGGPAGRYIVVLKAAVDSNAVAAEHARRYGVGIQAVYGHALAGYAAVVPAARLAALRADENVDYVEPDGEVTVSAQTTPWGITRIGAAGKSSISNVRAYVIDTGIDTAHADLNVVGHVNFAGGQNRDCHGHGTHVAGTIAARNNTIDVVGVAPAAPLVGVKVLSCSGSGSTSGVISGVNWVTSNAVKPAVANMSLGGGVSSALDTAVKNSANSGVFYAVAAGNSGANACNYSPAGAGAHNGVMTVAATDSSDREASWSNYGSCVDISGPGVSILSTRRGGGVTTMSGTSMASPHVAGTGARYLAGSTGASAATVESALKSSSVATGRTSKDGRAIRLVWASGY